MAIDTGIGVALDLVTTTAQVPLGQTVLQPAGTDGTGEKVWIYVQAFGPISAGDVCARDVLAPAGFVGAIAAPGSSATSRVLGVAQHAIAPGQYGWILKSGLATVSVLVPAATTEVAGEAVVVSGTPGQAAAAAAAADAFGFLTADLANAGGVPVLFQTSVVISCNG